MQASPLRTRFAAGWGQAGKLVPTGCGIQKTKPVSEQGPASLQVVGCSTNLGAVLQGRLRSGKQSGGR